jgi:hypothetical protein
LAAGGRELSVRIVQELQINITRSIKLKYVKTSFRSKVERGRKYSLFQQNISRYMKLNRRRVMTN